MTSTIKHKTREAWLTKAAQMLDKKFFADNGYELPEKLRASVGFAKASAMAIGQCWSPTVSADETYEIFICPTQDQPTRVLDILLHEMIHACVGLEEGHKGMFRKLAKEFGLEGKMTATYVTEGTELHKTLEVIAGRLGVFPHAAMKKSRGKGGGQKTKWSRYKSTNEEKYKVVAHDEHVAEFGPPLDPWGDPMVPNSE